MILPIYLLNQQFFYPPAPQGASTVYYHLHLWAHTIGIHKEYIVNNKSLLTHIQLNTVKFLASTNWKNKKER